jgi:hypothetical protein
MECARALALLPALLFDRGKATAIPERGCVRSTSRSADEVEDGTILAHIPNQRAAAGPSDTSRAPGANRSYQPKT